MSTTISFGQFTGAANDLNNAYSAWVDGAPFMPPNGYAEVGFTTFGAVLTIAGELTSIVTRK